MTLDELLVHFDLNATAFRRFEEEDIRDGSTSVALVSKARAETWERAAAMLREAMSSADRGASDWVEAVKGR